MKINGETYLLMAIYFLFATLSASSHVKDLLEGIFYTLAFAVMTSFALTEFVVRNINME